MIRSQEQDFGTYIESLQAWSESAHDSFVLHALDCSAIVAVTDTRGRILSANDKFVEISGYPREELIGQDHRMLHSGIHDSNFFQKMYRTIAQGDVWHGEICNRRKNGQLYWVDTTIVPRCASNGKVTNYVAIRFDITARKHAEQRLTANKVKLQVAVNTDFLTNISNRTSFSQYLKDLFTREHPDNRYVCLCLLDIDTFKAINDTSGHESGDRLLKRIANRLKTFQSPDCFIARIGGDEFAIILVSDEPQTFEIQLRKILETMRFRFRGGGLTHHCSASLGYAVSRLNDSRRREILRCADLALYEAKAEGRNRIKKYAHFMKEKTERRSRMRKAIQIGLKKKQFKLFYQLVLPRNTEHRPSFEALLRWDHPERGLLGPLYFHEAFEDAELSIAIGDFVLRQALMDIRHLTKHKIPFDRIAINVTSDDFRDHNFTERLFREMHRYSVPPDKITIEITEKILFGMHNQHILDELQKLHRAGIQISLDDFGTGFASLTHLRTVIFDHVKIDRVFTAGVTERGIDTAIIRGVIDIVHSMGRVVVAEGVETAEQADALAVMGCDFFQGWHFSKAIPLSQIPHILNLGGPPWIRNDPFVLDMEVAE
ncbi:putative bifunctional diguanylate cyclase/phosphodiesterase [Gluconobacter frateurii]|uniref:putative bifunctional diguanylate cyclase/phosphodiesterase n=1 Tax=Gluconobacter frateurii TaxID=38308 RepID=UPI0007CFE93F|nr:GGDEF domain-containing phosphodiesterase [Gluconobacter frateurii]OAG73266.1 diguanylate cyclase [Gluconobacter japonicus]UMM07125.1 EAL domain-containing protein [Gluconobacter frateurii]